MAVVYNDSEVVFEGAVHECEIVTLREHLQKCAPLKVSINTRGCVDIHTAIIQLIAAYHLVYGCDFLFPEREFAFVSALKGARICDNDINK